MNITVDKFMNIFTIYYELKMIWGANVESGEGVRGWGGDIFLIIKIAQKKLKAREKVDIIN